MYGGRVQVDFRGEVWYWRGPSPFHFVTVPEEGSGAIASASALVTYGWGREESGISPVEASNYLYGIAILAILVFAPGGLAGLVRRRSPKVPTQEER